MLTRPYYRNANAAVVVCDLTRPLTIDAVKDWKEELDSKLVDHQEGVPFPCILFGTVNCYTRRLIL